MTTITITLTNTHETSYYDLQFSLLDSSVAIKWAADLQKVLSSNNQIDDNERFYNFPNSKYSKEFVVTRLNELAEIVNNYKPGSVTRVATMDITQEDLNYFHHVFERLHGLYSTQDANHFCKDAPYEVRDALNQINITVHRCESLNSFPRFVCTWYHKPARKLLKDHEFDLFTFEEHFGDLRLNYCEVGKTLYDHWHDKDQYATLDNMLIPQKYYSADFTVRFRERSADTATNICNTLWQYVKEHEEKFKELGYSMYDKKLSLGSIPLAKLVYSAGSEEDIINQIGLHQKVHSIKII